MLEDDADGPKAGGVAVMVPRTVVAGAPAAAAASADWREADRTLRGLARRRAALDVEEAAWLRRGRALGIHREFGFATFLEYVERVLGYAPGAARERLRVADALTALPKLEAAMAAGDVAYSAARELTRVATSDTEADWLAAAANHTVRQIEEMVSGRRPGDGPDDPPDPAARLHELRLLVPAAVLGKFTATRRALEGACGHPLTDGDVLATLCDQQLAGSHVGDAATAKPMHQIAITQCSDCRKAWHDVAGHTIELSAAELAQASCDAELLGRVDGDTPARVTTTIPPRTRRAVLRRDRGRCVVPGCRNARYVDVHHLVPRVEGGDHTPTKLTALCSAHHTAAHDGRLRIEGTAPGKLRFVHADGRRYGAPPPGGEAKARSHVEAKLGAPPPTDVAGDGSSRRTRARTTPLTKPRTRRDSTSRTRPAKPLTRRGSWSRTRPAKPRTAAAAGRGLAPPSHAPAATAPREPAPPSRARRASPPRRRQRPT